RSIFSILPQCCPYYNPAHLRGLHFSSLFFFFFIRRPPRSPLFPYTTLLRSRDAVHGERRAAGHARLVGRVQHHAPEPSHLGLERSEEHTSELQSRGHLVCRLLLEKKKLASD